MARLSRRAFLAGAGLLGAGALTEGLVLEPRRLDVTVHTLGDRQSGGQRLRLAVLTDLHLKGLTDFHVEIADAVARANPAAIVIVGDAIDDPANLPLLSEFLTLLPRDGMRLATLGNWEHWSGVDLDRLRRAYAAADTRLLVNEGAGLSATASIFGTDDSLAGSPSVDGVVRDRDHETVLLSHCPEFRDSLASDHSGIRAVISGHTHGGQVALGGWAPLRPPGSGRYVAGWYRGEGPDLYVSRGLGTSIVPLRLGSVPEVALIDWYPST